MLVTQEGGRVPLLPDQVASVGGVYEFAWSPDGKSVVYTAYQASGSDLWVVPSTGGAARRLTSTGSSKKQPRWSPDGKWIAFVAADLNGQGDIQLVSGDGGSPVALTETPGDDGFPTWSPDTLQLAFTEHDGDRGEIASIDLESRTRHTLANVVASDLQWSPDGASLLFVSDPLQPNDDRRDNLDISMIAATGGPSRLLTPGTQRFRDFSPSWSPDSRRIAYVSELNGHSNIYILDIQTEARRAVTSGTVEHLSPSWSPDGKSIAYVRNDNQMFHLFVTPAETLQPVRLSDRDGVNGAFSEDSTIPNGMHRWSPDGKRIAFTHSDPGRVEDLWATTIGDTRSVQLTNSMPGDLRRESRFIWPETIKYRSFDGQEIGAFVYKPRGAKPRNGYPALLLFRDSLDGAHANSWDPFVQFFVSDGYLVFAPNVRGSGGQGKDYRQAVFEHGGDYDVRDAFFGLDRLSSEGLIDTERLGVLGAGTGGFLTTAAIVKDERRFKAAVSMYGIVDAVTAASYPGMEAWSRYMIGRGPMETPMPFYERSLVNFVDKLRTPIIFLYPGNDASAPFQQLQQFAVQAEVKGKWFDYRMFESESGGWRTWRQANFRLALEAMDAVFEKYLQGRDREIKLSRGAHLQ
jgi:dipeptidyl aminopeptidase/acylaminoacyl peptidase